MRALVIPANGSPYVTNVTGGYKQLQTLVDGLIDAVTHTQMEISGYVNDEGLVLGLPFNKVASVVFSQYLCGDVVVCGTPDEDGNDTDIHEVIIGYCERINSIRKWHEEAVSDREALSI